MQWCTGTGDLGTLGAVVLRLVEVEKRRRGYDTVLTLLRNMGVALVKAMEFKQGSAIRVRFVMSKRVSNFRIFKFVYY